MNDTIRSGTIAGLLGGIGDSLIHISAFFLLGATTTPHYISQLIFPFKDVGLIQFLFGFATHFFTSAIVGVGFALIFKYFGSDYPYYKGIGLGIVLWIIHVIVIPNIVAPRPFLQRTELEAFVDFIAHIVFSLFATVYLLKIQEKEGYRKHKI